MAVVKAEDVAADIAKVADDASDAVFTEDVARWETTAGIRKSPIIELRRSGAAVIGRLIGRRWAMSTKVDEPPPPPVDGEENSTRLETRTVSSEAVATARSGAPSGVSLPVVKSVDSAGVPLDLDSGFKSAIRCNTLSLISRTATSLSHPRGA